MEKLEMAEQVVDGIYDTLEAIDPNLSGRGLCDILVEVCRILETDRTALAHFKYSAKDAPLLQLIKGSS